MAKISLCSFLDENLADSVQEFISLTKELYNEWFVISSLDYTHPLFEHIKENGGKIINFTEKTHKREEMKNLALEQAQCDYILWLDVGEKPSPEFIASIKGIVSNPKVIAATATVACDNIKIKVPHREEIRFWKNKKNIRYEKPFYDDIGMVISKYLTPDEGFISHINGLIIENKQCFFNNKKEIKKKLSYIHEYMKYDFGDLSLVYQLLSIIKQVSPFKVVYKKAKEFMSVLYSYDEEEIRSKDYVAELVVLIGSIAYCKSIEEELLFLAYWDNKLDNDVLIRFRIAELYEKKGNIKKSKEYFESCLKDYGKNIYPNICSVRSMLGLSRLSLLEGDAENALEIIRFSIFQNPFDPEALFFLASLTYAAQGKKGLEDMGASLKADFGIESEWQGACAEHALWNSEVHAALAYLEKAQSSSDPRYRRLLWELQNNKIKKDFIASAG